MRPLQHLVFEFDKEADMRDLARRLWDHYKITGEMHIQPLPNGRWRLQVYSEKPLRESTLEKYAAFRVEPGED